MMLFAIAGSARADNPAWVVEPTSPGPDVPQTGGSLFDVLTLDARGERHVPFPFDRLVQRLEAAAGCTEHEQCTRAVLIPLGRSLQRVAASPDFFKHPRVVIAVTDQRDRGMPLRDRLFLGYQEAQGLIEAISYNDAAGRFEFQLIKNYREGAQPEVFQARRSVCISCHQNHAPIFSRQLWSETNANPHIASKLIAQKLATGSAVFQSIPIQGSTEISNAIDESTERANRLSVTQALWRSGCGVGASGERCRMAALRAALQFALASERGDVERPSELDDALAHAAKTLWPGGLSIPNPDIPNRDPLAHVHGARGAEITHIPAKLEALAARAPIETLPPQGEIFAKTLVRGLAATWSSHRIAMLDAALSRRKASRRSLSAPCRIARAGPISTFECSSESLHVSGAIDAASLSVDAVQVGSEPPMRQLSAKVIRRAADGIAFTLQERQRAARLATGDALERIDITWSGPAAVAKAVVRSDFSERFADVPVALADGALSELIDVAIAHVDALEHRPCCEVIQSRARVEPLPDRTLSGLGAALEPHCGACHRTPDASPPNFLTGSQTQVERQLASCAPRIFVRLAMSTLPSNQRDKTSMPPASMPQDEQAARALAKLQLQVQQLLRGPSGRVPSLDDLLVSGYERLPSCLPLTTPMH